MIRFYLFVALFSLFSIDAQLHAQAFGLNVQSCFSKVKISPGSGTSANGLNPTPGAGLFVEDRFNDHDAVGFELSGLQIKSQVSSLFTTTIFSPTGTSTSLTYKATVENKTQFIALNGYYRHMRGRWGLKGGMQCLIPLIETTKVTYDNNTFFQDNKSTDFGDPYFKVGITGGLEFAIDKRFRLGVDYCKEISHITRRTNRPLPGLQFFSLGLKFSFIKSRYPFT